VRNSGGPYFVEFKTYRWSSHFEADTIPDLRPKEEIASWKKQCPILRLQKKLLEAGILTEPMINDIGKQVMANIQEAVDYAVASPLPEPEDAMDDVFSA
jgi:acetoin:2,6-dichlorophenolindophenol oxidoreductase subunit alpha